MSVRSRSIRGLAVALALFGLAQSAQAGPTRYDPRRAGHPLRVAAYALHPVGVILDTLIFHPAWWVGTHEPFRTLFGVQVQTDDGVQLVAPDYEPDVDLEVEPEIVPDGDDFEPDED